MFCLFVLLFFLIQGDFEAVKLLLLGFAIIYAITVVIRTLYFKDRPEKFKHDSFLERLDASSFPSLHAARSTLVFAFLSSTVNKPYFTALCALIVLVTCISRIKLKCHDWKDVTAGIVLGLASFAISIILIR